MKILWSINTLMPDIANELHSKHGHAISWVDAMSKRIKNRADISLTMVAPGGNATLIDKTIDGIRYFLLPSDCEKKDYWIQILNEVNPDVIHVYGTETRHNEMLIKNHNNLPIVVSLQGLLTEYQKHYYAGIDFFDMVRFTSFRDLIRPVGFFSGRNEFKRKSKNEQFILKSVKHVEGRSVWDRASALNINPNLEYHYCPRMIRSPFFDYKWDANKMIPHTIFVHQGNYPIKGLHFVFEALAKIKRKYPDVKLVISGSNILTPRSSFDKYCPTGYSKYLKYLVKQFDIYENIEFTGYLNASQLAEKLSIMNVVVIPSAIENAPNSLAESTIVGAPTIASFVGGNMDMLVHNEEGYLYCYNEPNLLATYISRMFDDIEQDIVFSNKCITKYRKKHDPETLENMLLSIYNKIIG